MRQTFEKFQNELLVAAYDLSERTGAEVVVVRDIFAKYPITARPNWIIKALIDFGERGLTHEVLTHDGEMDQNVWLTAAGLKEAERLIDAGILLINADDLSATESDLGEREGLDSLIAQIAPASDRLVSISHNSDLQINLVAGVEDISAKISASNILPIDEKSDVEESLGLFQSLVRTSKTMLVGAFRYLVLERLKKAFEKAIEDAFKTAILLVLAGLVAMILAVL